MKRLLSGLAALLAGTAMTGSAHAGTLFMGSYPDVVMVIDEAKGAVVNRIKLPTGLPVNLRTSHDGKKIYVVTNTNSGIEEIDVASRRVIKSFTLNTPTERYRFYAGAPDPTGKLFYTAITKMEKLSDRWVVGKYQYAVIDLDQQKIVRTYDVPEEDIDTGFTGYGRGFVVSPDGKNLYRFGDKITIIDTSDFKVVEKIELAKTQMTGVGRASFGGDLDLISREGQHVSVFNVQDPYVNNKVFGIGRFDLNSRRFDFTPIGPAPAGMSGLQVSPDGRKAYTIVGHSQPANAGNAQRRCEAWRLDVASKTVEQKVEIPCRTRFEFDLSSDGRKLYMHGAGFEIDVYNAATLKHERTWDLNGDITMAGMISFR
jgi:DNA-binding beta-propeller fold protein YncE